MLLLQMQIEDPARVAGTARPFCGWRNRRRRYPTFLTLVLFLRCRVSFGPSSKETAISSTTLHPSALVGIQQWVRMRYGVSVLIMVVPHTFGGDLKFNPHLHILVSAEGLSESEGRWIPNIRLNKDALMRMSHSAVIDHLRRAARANVLKSDLGRRELGWLLQQHTERIPGVTGVLALAAGAAVAVAALLPAGHPGSHQPRVQLAAWTVVQQPGGIIHVTIRELRDPAGLQAALRADGVPASVSFGNGQQTACRPYPGGGFNTSGNPVLINSVFPQTGVNIRPSALPSGTGVLLAFSQRSQHGVPGIGIEVAVVQASQQCTGS